MSMDTQTPNMPAKLFFPYIPSKHGYQEKLDAILNGAEVTFTPGEFLRFVLIDRDRQHSKEHEILQKFEDKCGYVGGHLRRNIFYSSQRLPVPLCDKLVGLCENVQHNYYFWHKPSFQSSEAKDVSLVMTHDIQRCIRHYNRLSHRRKEAWAAGITTESKDRNSLTP